MQEVRSNITSEIEELERQLEKAELAPDPDFFETYLDDQMVIMAGNQIAQPKKMIVQAHTPDRAQKFTSVKMSEMRIIEQAHGAVVTCTGEYEGPDGKHILHFMRVWLKKDGHWKVIAASMY